MKKIYVAALSAVTVCGAFMASCDGGLSSSASLKTEVDSISYAYGGAVSEQLIGQMQQMGLYSDTAQVNSMFKAQIAAEQDPAKKAELEKTLKTRFDSITKVNAKNLAEFVKGFQEGIKATEAQNAYYMGLTSGQRLSQQFPSLMEYVYGEEGKNKKVDAGLFMTAINAGIKKEKLAIEEPGAWFDQKLKGVQERNEAKKEAELAKQYGPQIEEGKKFLEENGKKEGVVTLPSGIQYKVLKAGNGAKPTANDQVTVDYTGTLTDGTKFDSSIDRKQPFKFNLAAGSVIKGWTEIVQQMPVGSKWVVYIPYDLAYGAQDRGVIKPFSNLVFEIELLSIDTPSAQPAQ